MNRNGQQSLTSVSDIIVKDSGYYDWIIKKYGPLYRCLSAEYQFISSSQFLFDFDPDVKWRLQLEFKQDNKDLIYVILKEGCLKTKSIHIFLSVLDENDKVLLSGEKKISSLAVGVIALSLTVSNQIFEDYPSSYDNALKVRFRVVYYELINDVVSPLKKPKFDLSENLFKDEKFSDAKIKIGDHVFYVHKCVLCIRSTYFSTMFQSDMKESRKNEVEVTDVSREVMQEVLRFIYTNKVENINALKTELFIAADKYLIEDLKVMCEGALARDLRMENVVNMLIFSDRYELKELKSAALKFFLNHKKEIMT